MPVPEFVARLRTRVGHDPLWLTGVTAVVVRQHVGREQVLLVRRADDGRWTAVTGIVDPGEHPATTAVREVAEETTVSCAVEGLAAVAVTAPVTYANGDRAQYVDHTFRCRFLDGTPRVGDDESQDVRWYDVAALPALTAWHRGRIEAALTFTGVTRLD